MAEQTGNYQASGRQKVRLFLEGREVPVSSVSISASVGAAVTASIEVVPLSVIKFIRPRTQVHIFVRDSMTFGDGNFYLCFEGEVVGRSLVKRHDGRSVVLSAIDYSGYLDDARAFIMNPNFLAGKATTGVFEGEPTPQAQAKAAAGKVLNTVSNQTSLMIEYLTRYKDSEGNIDIVRGCMEIARQLATVNEFYRAAYERLRILDRMFVKSSGRTGRMFSSIRVEEFLSSYTGQTGGMTNLRQMLNGVMEMIFHEFVSIPFPSLVKVKRENPKSEGFSLSQFVFIPDCYLLPPPRCNVIFPSQQIGFEFSDDFRAAPTRMGFRYAFPMVANEEVQTFTYPIKYYPTPFADYMYGGAKNARKSTSTELNSALGPSKFINGKDGQNYASIFYGDKAKEGSKLKAVGTSYMPTLRESDYLSNEESLRGIYYATEVLSPSYTAMVRGGKVTDPKDEAVKRSTSRDTLMQEMGKYIFFKKRYGARQVGASIMFNPFLVPGFTALFLDDSDAGQSFIAKLQTVNHTLTNQGFSTTVSLAYARDFDEVDLMTGGVGDPPLPSWFDPTLFGSVDTENGTSKSDNSYFAKETKYLGPADSKEKGRAGGLGILTKDEVDHRNKKVINPTIYTKLSDFYQGIVACNSITGVGSATKDAKKTQEVLVTTNGAALWLIDQYKKKSKEPIARDTFVREYIKRPVPTMEQAFEFVGAEVVPFQNAAGKSVVPEEFAMFKAIKDPKKTGLPGRFDGTDGASNNYSDKIILELRRNIIDIYVKQLKERRGFRG